MGDVLSGEGLRTLIVQGIVKTNIEDAMYQEFWKPCMVTVQKWAKINGWDYKFFDSARSNEFDLGELEGTKYINNRQAVTQTQFFKFQWMDGWTEYDRVYWLDADCYIYGHPLLFAHGTREDTGKLNFCKTELILGRYWRPYMAAWGGSTKLVQQAIDWVKYQFEHPDDQDELLTVLRRLNRDHNDNLSDEQRVEFTEEIMLSAYTNNPQYSPHVELWSRNTRYFVMGRENGLWRHNQLIHFGGPEKYHQLNKFRAWKAYMAYISRPEAQVDKDLEVY